MTVREPNAISPQVRVVLAAAGILGFLLLAMGVAADRTQGFDDTVLRALRTLRDEGLVEFRRGRGVTVTSIGPQRSAVVAKARELVALARRYGYQPQELAEIIEQVS